MSFSAFVCLIFLFTFWAQPLQAQPDLYFEKVGNDNDIPAGIVMDLASDKKGFLWIATQQGLIRYDGYQYQRFTNNPDDKKSLADNFIQTIMVAPDNKIWSATGSNGISILDQNTGLFKQLTPTSKPDSNILLTNVTALTTKGDNSVFIGTPEGLFKYKRSTNEISKVLLNNDANKEQTLFSVHSLHLDQDKNLWLANNKGVYVLPHNKNKLLSAAIFLGFSSAFFNKSMQSIYVTTDNNIWLGSSHNGYGYVDKKQNKVIYPTSDDKITQTVYSITQVSDSELWIGVYNKGIYQVNLKTNQVKSIITNNNARVGSISGNQIKKILLDPSGVIWAGTWGRGLNKHLPNSTFKTKYVDVNKVSTLYVRSAFESSDGRLWLGSNKGLKYIDKATGELRNFKNNTHSKYDLSIQHIDNINQAEKDKLLLATRTGLYQIELATNKVNKLLPIQKEVIKLLIKGNKSAIWLATNNALYSYQLESDTLQNFPYLDSAGNEVDISNIRVIKKDSSGRIWLGSFKGLFVLEPNSKNLKKITPLNNDDNFKGVIALTIDKNNRLWFSASAGLFSFSLENWQLNSTKITKATVNVQRDTDKLFSNLQVDSQGRLWEATLMFDPAQDKVFEFGKAEGIDIGADWISSYTQLNNGKMVFGGSQGLLITSPEKFSPWRYTPPIVLSDFRVDGIQKKIDNSKVIAISSAAKSISAEFSALDYSAPELINYQYQLTGYDSDWQENNTKKRNVSYTNLPPGLYTLKVKATNRAKQWTNEKVILSFKLLPAFYQTWLFKLGALLTTVIIITFFIRWRVKKLAEKEHIINEMLLASERAELMSELVNSKNQLLADVSHELRTPLTVLQLRVEALQHNLVKDVDASYESLMSKIMDINSLIADIYQLSQSDIGALKFDKCQVNCHNTFDLWSRELSEMIKEKGFDYQQTIEIPKDISINIDKDKIKQVLCNLVNNSITYTDLPGTVKLTATVENTNLKIIIEDSSPGVAPENMAKIFERLFRVESSRSRATGGSGLGLSICKSIIEAHQGTISSSASQYGGLAISIELPLKVT